MFLLKYLLQKSFLDKIFLLSKLLPFPVSRPNFCTNLISSNMSQFLLQILTKEASLLESPLLPPLYSLSEINRKFQLFPSTLKAGYINEQCLNVWSSLMITVDKDCNAGKLKRRTPVDVSSSTLLLHVYRKLFPQMSWFASLISAGHSRTLSPLAPSPHTPWP